MSDRTVEKEVNELTLEWLQKAEGDWDAGFEFLRDLLSVLHPKGLTAAPKKGTLVTDGRA